MQPGEAHRRRKSLKEGACFKATRVECYRVEGEHLTVMADEIHAVVDPTDDFFASSLPSLLPNSKIRKTIHRKSRASCEERKIMEASSFTITPPPDKYLGLYKTSNRSTIVDVAKGTRRTAYFPPMAVSSNAVFRETSAVEVIFGLDPTVGHPWVSPMALRHIRCTREEIVDPGLPPPGSPLSVRTGDQQQGNAPYIESVGSVDFQEGNAGYINAAINKVKVEDVQEAQKKRIVKMLLKGDIYGLPGSEGTRWSNFREWAKNQHPVLSMFMAHELHPFSKTERFSVMMCYLCWAFFITVLFEMGNSKNLTICNAQCNHTYSGTLTNGGQEESICGEESGINEGQISLDEYNAACDRVMPWFLMSFIIAAFTVPYRQVQQLKTTMFISVRFYGSPPNFSLTKSLVLKPAPGRIS
eukprot:jgi/Undpi1/6789/HiC_scaffold_21.g09266.m1